jgi:hypothetical protein
MEKQQTAPYQQPLHQRAVTESAMETKLTSRVQKMVAHTAVMESAMVMTPMRLVQTMVASRQVNAKHAKKDTLQTAPVIVTALRKAG